MTEAEVLLGNLIADAGAMLAAARVPEPRREALRLWADLVEGSPVDAILGRRAPVSSEQVAGFLSAVERRAGGEPLAYVSGRAGFRRLTLGVDRRVLIPRPETEGLVELVLTHAPRGIVADVCTGSGCIALSLADEGRYERVLGVDLSARRARRGGRQRSPHGPAGRAGPGRPDGLAGDGIGRCAGGQSAIHRAP